MIHRGDALAVLKKMKARSVQTCVTSPPYWGLRDYGAAGQIGLEPTPDAYVARIVDVFREVRRVLKDDGTLWLNLGDSYNSQPGQRSTADKHGAKQATNKGSNDTGSRATLGLKAKNLVGIPWRVAFALQADGWILRSDIIWQKPNPMPESVRDRPTKAHEYLFLLAKSARYFYDADAIREPLSANRAPSRKFNANGVSRPYHSGNTTRKQRPGADSLALGNQAGAVPWEDTGQGRNARTVWTITPRPFKGAHFATFPPALVEPCVRAGSRPGDRVLDPFSGAGTTVMVAESLGRVGVGIELNPEYIELARARLQAAAA